MSLDAMTWAFRQDGLSDGEARTLLAIADHADDEGICWPGHDRLADKCETTDRTIRNRLATMTEKGMLHQEERRRDNGSRTTNRIFLHLDNRKNRVGSNRKNRDNRKLASGPEPSVGRGEGSEVKKANGKDPSKDVSMGSPLQRPPQLRVDGLKVTDAEWVLALAALARFNERNGTKWGALTSRSRPSPHLTPIICRIRENPELALADHLRIIDESFAKPYWTGKATVGNVYGPTAFVRGMAGRKGPTRRPRFQDERLSDEGEQPW